MDIYIIVVHADFMRERKNNNINVPLPMFNTEKYYIGTSFQFKNKVVKNTFTQIQNKNITTWKNACVYAILKALEWSYKLNQEKSVTIHCPSLHTYNVLRDNGYLQQWKRNNYFTSKKKVDLYFMWKLIDKFMFQFENVFVKLYQPTEKPLLPIWEDLYFKMLTDNQ